MWILVVVACGKAESDALPTAPFDGDCNRLEGHLVLAKRGGNHNIARGSPEDELGRTDFKRLCVEGKLRNSDASCLFAAETNVALIACIQAMRR